MNVTLHPSDVVVVDLHQHAVFQFAVLLSARVQLDLAVKGAHLLNRRRD